MQTAGDALLASNNTISTLSYLDTLITDATLKGLYFIVVDSKFITQEISDILILSYGYNVYEKIDEFSQHVTYIVDWSNPSPGPK